MVSRMILFHFAGSDDRRPLLAAEKLMGLPNTAPTRAAEALFPVPLAAPPSDVAFTVTRLCLNPRVPVVHSQLELKRFRWMILRKLHVSEARHTV